MKTISTTVKTGNCFKVNGLIHHVGLYKNGKISIRIRINDTSCCNMQLSTRELNKLLNQKE